VLLPVSEEAWSVKLVHPANSVVWNSSSSFKQIDSILGATLQQTLYDTDKGKILLDGAAEEQKKLVGVDSHRREIVSGIKILSNNQVNFISSAVVAALFGYVGFVSA
jgi:uncharacterized membrane protein